MTRINTNIASLQGLRNLNKSGDLLNTSLTRLSTGLQINSGKDNPSGLIASESLGLQVTSINQSIQNSNRANNVISTADGALGEISGLLSQVRGLVQEGLNNGALSQSEIEANQQQIDTALSAINRISSNTTFNGEKLIDGSKAFNTKVSTVDSAKLSDYNINEALLGSKQSVTLNTQVTSQAQRAQLRYSGGDLQDKATIEVSGSNGQEVLFLGGSSSIQNVRDAVNNVSDTTGVTARVLNGTSQTIAATQSTATIASTTLGSDVKFTRVDGGTDATLGGKVSITYTDPAANNAALGATTTVNASGDVSINISLATDGTGTITSTNDSIAALIAGDATASQYVTAAAEGTGGDLAVATASTDLAGGTDSGTLNFIDKRASNATGNINVVLADPARTTRRWASRWPPAAAIPPSRSISPPTAAVP